MDEKPRSVEEDMRRAGYSQEELYFYRLNRELIERRRTRPPSEQPHMRCPNCEQQLGEADVLGIRVARCGDCGGIFLGQAEVETLLEAKDSHVFLKRLKKLFKPPEEAQLF